MKDYRKNQLIYQKLTKHQDLIENISYREVYESDNELVERVVKYFTDSEWKNVFPAKSYAVAIIYAFLIEKYFNEKYNEVLKDINLFVGTDKYFEPLSDTNRDVYRLIIKRLVAGNLLDFEKSKISHVQVSCEYFKRECLLKGF